MPKFVTLFPETEDVHMVKDMAQIPYYLYKKYGYDSEIVTYQNGEYPSHKYIEGVKLKFIPKTTFFNKNFGAFFYLISNSTNIQILNLYHFSARTILFGITYKFLNPGGYLYLKSDLHYDKLIKNEGIVPKRIDPLFKSLANGILDYFLTVTNLVSIELRKSYDAFIKYYPGFKDKTVLLSNGIHTDNQQKASLDQKENIITCVARIGTEQKNIAALLEAAKTSLGKWKLQLIGPIEEDFNKHILEYFKTNPEMEEKIEFTGNIADRAKLYSMLRKSKVFISAAIWESFGIDMVEAQFAGNFIITTPVVSAEEIVSSEKLGIITKGFSSDDLAEALKQLDDMELNKKTAELAHAHAAEKFSWDKIIESLHNELSKYTA
jgi:glycosyltransferase involved in cell wall biosynthesis